MTIQYMMVKRENDGSTSANGFENTKKEILRRFKEFLDNHGTHCDDYDEFHCRFVEEESKER